MKNKEQGNQAWNRGNEIGRFEGIREVMIEFNKFEEEIDELMDEFTNGFGSEDYNHSVTRFKEKLKQLQNARI